jgi:hypothetical protein
MISSFLDMTMRIKTGGRQKGTPNKRTEEIQAKLEELECDPIEGMARIAASIWLSEGLAS